MTINYQFGDVDAHGAMIRALAGLLEAEHQAIISDVLTASDFWGGAGSAACQGFITQLGRNFQVIYEGCVTGWFATPTTTSSKSRPPSRSSAANVSRCSTILSQTKENRFDDHQLSVR